MRFSARNVALLATAVAAGILAVSTPAFASASAPGAVSSFRHGVLCSGDVCVAYGGTGAEGAIVYYAAGPKAFTGHFRALGPGGFAYTSPTHTWAANGMYHDGTAGNFNIRHPKAGNYCVTGYKTNGASEGRRCVYNS